MGKDKYGMSIKSLFKVIKGKNGERTQYMNQNIIFHRMEKLMKIYDISEEKLFKKLKCFREYEYIQSYIESFKRYRNRTITVNNDVVKGFFKVISESELGLKEGSLVKYIFENTKHMVKNELLVNTEAFEWFEDTVCECVLQYAGIKIISPEEKYQMAEKVLLANKINYSFENAWSHFLENDEILLRRERKEREEICGAFINAYERLDELEQVFIYQNAMKLDALRIGTEEFELIRILVKEKQSLDANRLFDVGEYLKSNVMLSGRQILDNAKKYSSILCLDYPCKQRKISKRNKGKRNEILKITESVSLAFLENSMQYLADIARIDRQIAEFIFVFLCTNAKYTVSEEGLDIEL